MLKTYIHELTSTPTMMTSSNEVEGGCTISIQNLDETAYIYLGNESVTSSLYGVRLSPGETWSADLRPYEEVYAVGSAQASVFIMER